MGCFPSIEKKQETLNILGLNLVAHQGENCWNTIRERVWARFRTR
uniref:Uncharacterized protein n=1 Tax=Rhizophora mucronata TaxID=61149 RepID=A0A2P2IQJ9_RHIMU